MAVLTYITSGSGDIVPIYDGRALCSRVNPRREAEIWEQKIPDLSSYAGVILLGLGGGYHLELLFRRTDINHLVVLECLPAIKINTKLVLPAERFTLEYFAEPTAIIKQTWFANVMRGKVKVLSFFPAWQSVPRLYQQAQNVVTGRIPESFCPIAHLRNCRWGEMMAGSPDKKLLSIKDVLALIKKTPVTKWDKSVYSWLILEELIK